MRKIIGFVLSAAMAVSCLSFPAYAESDYATRGEVVEMLLEAADNYNPTVEKSDIIHGDGSGLNEDRNVTRAEALVMLSRAFGDLPEPEGQNKILGYKASNFTDIPDWAMSEIQQVFDSGIVAGTSNSTFSPNDNVTKEQMRLFISRVYALYGTSEKDDFYAAVNKNALDAGGDSQYMNAGAFAKIQEKVDSQLDDVVDSVIYSVSSYKIDTREQHMNDFYKMAVDTEARNKLGLSPIEDSLEAIDAAESMDELGAAFETVYEDTAVKMFIDFSYDINPLDTDTVIKTFEVQAPLMYSDVYIGGAPEDKAAYLDYISDLLVISGESEEEAESNAESVFELEKQINAAALSSGYHDDDYLSADVNYISFDNINAAYEDFDLTFFLNMTEMPKSGRIVIVNEPLFEATAAAWTDENIDAVKEYAKFLFMDANVFDLNDDLAAAGAEFYGYMYDEDEFSSTEWVARETIKDVFGNYINDMYRDKYCDTQNVSYIENLTRDLISVYKEDIDECEWLSDETKEKAKAKLDGITIKAVCAEPYETALDKIRITPYTQGGKYFETLVKIRRVYDENALSVKSGDKIDKSAWYMYNYTVNAAYNPYFNDITIPNGILDSSLYKQTASKEENLAGIGFIIAHELAHAISGIGLDYDEEGNLSRWVTDDEYRTFEKIGNSVADFYDGREAAPGIRVDGEQTLEENMADLLALQCITDAAAELISTPDYAKMYELFAEHWCELYTHDGLEEEVEIDNHSPGKLRVNVTLGNTDKFYDVFNIEEGDGMYTAPENRITVWQ